MQCEHTSEYKKVPFLFVNSPGIIDLIVRLRVDGLTYLGISEKLNSLGYKPSKGHGFTESVITSLVSKYRELIVSRAKELGVSDYDIRKCFCKDIIIKDDIQPVLFERTQPAPLMITGLDQQSVPKVMQTTQEATKPEPEPEPKPESKGVAMNLNTGDATMPSLIASPTVKVRRLKPGAKLPVYKTAGAVGCDLSACCDEPWIIKAGETVRIGTGIALNLSYTNLYGELHLRSGLTAKYLTLANNVGVIDQDYTGEIMVALTNTSRFYGSVIEPGERIAQLVFKEMIRVTLEETSEQVETQRGNGGFGSTGKF